MLIAPSLHLPLQVANDRFEVIRDKTWSIGQMGDLGSFRLQAVVSFFNFRAIKKPRHVGLYIRSSVYALRRLIAPSPSSAEPKSHAAAGIGTSLKLPSNLTASVAPGIHPAVA